MKTKRKYKKIKIKKQNGGEEFFSKIGNNLQKNFNDIKIKVESKANSLKNGAKASLERIKNYIKSSKLCNMGGSNKTQKNRKKYKK